MTVQVGATAPEAKKKSSQKQGGGSMSTATKAIIIALIGALSSIGAAWVTAGGVAKTKTDQTINESGSEIAELQKKIADAAQKADEARIAAEQARGPCPSLSVENLGSTRTFYKTHQTTSGVAVELLSVSGKGCLVAGAVLGYYNQRLQGDENYAVQLEIDGQTHKYPATDQPVAYAQGIDTNNSGVLALPTIRYSRSLRITYYYPGTNVRLNGYAVIIPEP
jgi:hypothetical protein